MASIKKVLKEKGYIEIKLKKTTTKHFELKAKINGVKGRFILDTGASNSCVGTDKIAYFKLTTQVSETKASGAGATGMDTQKSLNNRLKIGKWKMKNCHLVIFDLTHVNAALKQHNAKKVAGIIGADVFEKGAAIIHYKRKKLYLKQASK